MKAKLVVPRRQADEDVDRAADFYLREAGPDIALAFVHSVEHSYAQISRLSGTGSPRYAESLEITGLRFWKAKKFPYLIFYVDIGSHIEILRVLHERMDVPAWIGNDE
ncbi:MAG: type II toxin-antitoxin system RelE/ParE family toxin [bacterium]|nr:type II toxin-antitoxin system RelE/ParE family toxin [bacterium]